MDELRAHFLTWGVVACDEVDQYVDVQGESYVKLLAWKEAGRKARQSCESVPGCKLGPQFAGPLVYLAVPCITHLTPSGDKIECRTWRSSHCSSDGEEGPKFNEPEPFEFLSWDELPTWSKVTIVVGSAVATGGLAAKAVAAKAAGGAASKVLPALVGACP